ncbi:low molecular weight phosphatase family protein [Corynebacterium mendelii]|uniref:Low molecular weight phosphatase family protein n=1 Tax=Corynebacterium mendelii TaxID=2765362 RepID=A0A939E0E7_9CORY|nr:low molecular weight phosphatase family protein [Corynebacterium mendelii]MBN9643242.1 low molecular weight phosphatase family protein [Corynebacterium mendelii]
MTGSPTPTVLFVCVKNGGKSQMAAALARLRAGDRLKVLSAGTRPGKTTSAAAEESVKELGCDFGGAHPTPVDPAWLDEVDRIVIIGEEAELDHTGRAPVERWITDEPSLRGIDGTQRLRLIRDDIDRRVTALVADICGSD